MPLLRRKTPAAEVPAEPETIKPGGKGRATPTRKEAQAARRGRPASTSSKSSSGKSSGGKGDRSAAREERRQQSQTYREAMLSGDVNKLPPRERAPERVIARDVVDRRRNFGPVFLAILVLNLASGFIQSTGFKIFATYLLMLSMLIFVLDAYLISRQVQQAVRARYPESRVPVRFYAIQRSILPGRFRMPRSSLGQVAGFLPAKVRAAIRRR